MAKPQRRAVSPLRGEVRPQRRFCPLQTCSPHSKPSQPPLGAWRAGRVHPHLFSVWQLGDALSFPRYSPSFAAGGPRVWGHSRFSPAAFGPAGVSPLRGEVRQQKRFCPLQMCSPHSKPSQPPLGAWRAGRVHPHLFSVWQLGDALSFPCYSLSFRRRRAVCVGTQSILPCSVRTPCWPPVSPALHTPSTRTRTPRALLRGGGCRCSRFGPATHFSLGNIPPPPRRGSTDGSEQRLQGFCSTAVAFLPPTERSDRGNTAVGHRTRVLQPKGYGGLRPILDLRRLNFSLYKGKFKMLTMRTIMSQVQEGDWFVTIDLKDAYFHIQVVLRYRRFLRFAFGGKAYQYKVLPFGLALAPRTFTKCMDAALAPLRLQGIRVLNYLDDWLILAHSRELVSRHRDIVLGHIHSLGLRMNAKKSVLLPSQRTVFLGVRLDSVQMQAQFGSCPDTSSYSMSGPLQARPSCLCRYLPQAVGPYGSSLPCVAPRAASHEAIPLVDEGAEVTPHCTSYSPYQGVAQLLSTPVNVARPRLSQKKTERGENGCDPPSPLWSRRTHQWQAGARSSKEGRRVESGRKSSSFGI